MCHFPFPRLLCFRGSLPPLVRCGVVPLLLALAATVVVGVVQLPAFSITLQGLVATLLPAAEAADGTSYTLLGLGLALPHAAGDYAGTSALAVRALQAALLGTLLAVPLSYTSRTFRLVGTPHSKGTQAALLRCAQRCFAWAGLDVFVLTILAGLAAKVSSAEQQLLPVLSTAPACPPASGRPKAEGVPLSTRRPLAARAVRAVHAGR